VILDRLVLHNFKRFRDAEIRFRDGITGILGNNGTGKSSLVSAVLFALYGVRATGITADYIVSSFASPREKCEVRLDFRIGGDTYTVLRTFRKGKSITHDAEFFRNGKLVAKEVSPVEEAVKRTLGMGPTDFRNTIYAAQKDLLTLLENTPGKRKEWFLRALGIDYLNTESQKILKEEIDAKTATLRRTEGELAALAGKQTPEELARLEAAVAASRAAMAEHGRARDAKRAERDALGVQQQALAEKKLQHTALLRQLQACGKEKLADEIEQQKLGDRIALLAGEEAEYGKLKPVAGTHDEVRQQLAALREKRARHQQLAAELGFAEREIVDLQVRAERQRQAIAALDADLRNKDDLVLKVRQGLGAGDIAEDRLESAVSYRLAEINKTAGTLAARLAQYTAEREKIASDRKTIEKAGADGVCPLCRQKLGGHFGSIEAEFSARLQELEEKAVSDLARQERLAAEKSAVEALKPQLSTLRILAANLKQRPAYGDELRHLEAAVAQKAALKKATGEAIAALAYDENAFRAAEQKDAELQALQLRFIDLGKKIARGTAAKEQLERVRQKIAERTAEIAKLSEEIRTIAFDPAAVAALDARIAQADASLRSEEVAIATAAQDLRFAEEKIAEFRSTGERVAALQEQAAELADGIELLKLTRGLIAEYVVYLMQVVRSRLEGEVSRIISEITGGRYEQVLLDEDFNLFVRDIDSDYPVDRFSGGEQDDIAVALRIALSRYLAGLHNVHESTVLIFDEIFGSQDEERRSGLLTALRTQESRFPQILLISHIAEMQGEFSNTLVVEAGADGASRVREAE
jgi:exonuclease SbcC